MFAGKKSAQIREILISESAWEEMTCLFAPSLVRMHHDFLDSVGNYAKDKALNIGDVIEITPDTLKTLFIESKIRLPSY
ncbi:TPA: hypothetical protein MCV55_004261 [Klebsiella pneumoniae]|nr:hypothetical protein [Klebsiella pneumoniae]